MMSLCGKQIITTYLLTNISRAIRQSHDLINIKIYDVASWETSNWNIHIAQYLKK